ncbi:MAG: ABC transporter substrate-binding protein [Candidatus Hydrogenedentales bacterium]|jgi:sn-glycerol 3-phosphate transport system substrate-binding protein
MPRRTPFLLLICGVATLIFSGCGNQTPDNSSASVTYWRTLTGASGEAQDELADQFNAITPAIHVTSEFQGSYSDLATKLLTALAGGSGPEVSQLGTFEIRQFAKSGALVDLKPYLTGPNGIDMTGWPESLANAGAVGDGIYWLPFNVAVPVLYYNQDAFTEAGITEPPATWDAFFDEARRLTKRDASGNVERYGVAFWNITWPLFSMVWSEGGELTTRDYDNITLDDPVVVRLLTQIQALVREGSAVLPDKASGGHRAAFLNGHAAMILDSQDAFGEVFGRPLEFTPGVANYPAGAKGKMYAPGGGGIVMLASTPEAKREAAWTFMRFMLDTKQIAYYAKRTGYLAFTKEAQEMAKDLLLDPRYRVIHDALPHVRGDFSVNMSPAVRNAFDTAFQKILVENADVQATLSEADAQAERAIKKELEP